MKTASLTKVLLRAVPALALLSITPALRAADEAAPASLSITINVDQVKGPSSPNLYGLMTEEINYSYDGGLYAELVANRTFREKDDHPQRWSLVEDPGASGTMDFDTTEKYNDQLPISLKLTATTASDKLRVGFSNSGFWGIPVQPNTAYHASFYAKASGNFTGPLSVAISSTKDPVTYAYATVPKLTNTWQKYEVTLKTNGSVKPTKDASFLVWTNAPGTAWFSLVSLFPPTYHNRPNGMRQDIMQLLADYHPAFLRFPGGNYVEGHTPETRFNWKTTIGDISQRPGHVDDSWNYYSTDGVGLLEFLEWCEDLKMQPLLAVPAGLYLSSTTPVVPAGPDLEPLVQDALDEIEYVTGDVNSKWGGQRAKDGHPAPFKLDYVEIGNEDNLSGGAGSYDGRFSQFYNAIKAKYPNIKLIATTTVRSVTPDVRDNHTYPTSEFQSESQSTGYDKADRNGPKVFEGEWATRVGVPTPNFQGALGDAALMSGFERNSDLVIMASYAPLFVNVSNPVANGRDPATSMQWRSDLIGYDALTSYGSPPYYAQVMFNNHRGDQILTTSDTGIAPRDYQQPGNRGGAPTTRQVASLFYVATRDSKTGTVYLNLVNPLATPQSVHIDLKGAASVAANGESVIMKADNLSDTNSITEPTKITPVTAKETGFSSSFTRTLAPYSINILEIGTK